MIVLIGPCMFVAPLMILLVPVAIVLWPVAVVVLGVGYLAIWPFALVATRIREARGCRPGTGGWASGFSWCCDRGTSSTCRRSAHPHRRGPIDQTQLALASRLKESRSAAKTKGTAPANRNTMSATMRTHSSVWYVPPIRKLSRRACQYPWVMTTVRRVIGAMRCAATALAERDA